MGVVGDGSFVGVRAAIAELELPLDVAHLPALLTLATLPCDPRAAIVDVDGQLSMLVSAEAALEAGTNAAAARLGVATTTIDVTSPLRVRVGETLIALHATDRACVVEVD